MNRMEEYEALLSQLKQTPPGLDGTLDRAMKKKARRRKLILRPLGGLAACFAIFVLLVNYCAPVAYACSKVPGLRELAEAVTFSRSLTDAVDNEYVQPMNLTQTQNGITAEIAYLIVDQKQINVFYSLDSEEYEFLDVNFNFLTPDGTSAQVGAWSAPHFDPEKGGLRSVCIDYLYKDVPNQLALRLKVYETAVHYEEVAPEGSLDDLDQEWTEPEYLAEFDFLLEFDPKFTANGKVFPVNQTVMLGDQTIIIEDIQVYPTHLRVNIVDSPENTAWLKGLDFYIETDWGMRFDTVSNGISATGSEDTRSMVSYRADSTYFYEAKHLKLVITGAEWLRKDMERVYVNLVTGETGELPEGVTFDSATRTDYGWKVRFRVDYPEDEILRNNFGHSFYDADGNKYEINTYSSLHGERVEQEDGTGEFVDYREFLCYYDEFPLKNFHGDEVWFTPNYSHNWKAENEIVIIVQ